MTDQEGTIRQEYEYSPHGRLLQGSFGAVDFLYNGQYGVASDGNGLYYMRARYYNTDILRFMNQDILVGSIGDSQSLNRYAYVEGNPVSFLDPFGLEKNDYSVLNSLNGVMDKIDKTIHDLADVRDYVVEKYNLNFVLAIGIDFGIGSEAYFNGGGQIVMDAHGNSGFQGVYDTGISMIPCAKADICISLYPGKNNISEIEGFGAGTGGTLGEGTIGAIDFMFEGEGSDMKFSGISLGYGIGATAAGAEGHVKMSETLETFHFIKIGQIWDNIYSKWKKRFKNDLNP